MSRRLIIKIILLVAVLSSAPDLYAGTIAVIVNEAGPLTLISRVEVKDIYLGNLRFKDNVRVLPLNYREGAVKGAFLSSVLGMRPKEYRRYWMTKSFQEGIILPKPKKNYRDIIAQVKRTPGAIGYLPESELGEITGVRTIVTIEAGGP
ncbi:MAG: hypothetical protein BMS9Abin24_021 [Thermodesulfobacteriota bacterium]|nr:MAG: hypothetical protein BMS9Abin24_021 [Thermodesulfobacteriota bacterium]